MHILYMKYLQKKAGFIFAFFVLKGRMRLFGQSGQITFKWFSRQWMDHQLLAIFVGNEASWFSKVEWSNGNDPWSTSTAFVSFQWCSWSPPLIRRQWFSIWSIQSISWSLIYSTPSILCLLIIDLLDQCMSFLKLSSNFFL